MGSRKSHEPQTQSNLPPLGRLLDNSVVATAGVGIAAIASANAVEKNAVLTGLYCGKTVEKLLPAKGAVRKLLPWSSSHVCPRSLEKPNKVATDVDLC